MENKSKRPIYLRYHAACAVAREAGIIARGYFLSRDMTVALKGPQDFLTEADGAVEKFVAHELGRLFPEDGLLGEEGSDKTGELLWIVDPIDGTANFARALPHFCISIALVSGERTLLGIIYDPIKDELFSAIAGEGAWLNGKKMSVSKTKQFDRALFELGWSNMTPQQTYLTLINDVLSAGASFRRAGSGALALAYVADGRQEGYAELRMQPWDALAGMLMVREAGGWTNDYPIGGDFTKARLVMATTIPLSSQFSAIVGSSEERASQG